MYGVNTSDEIREFLASRRSRITPERAGLPAYGGKHRVPGLRREEVALLTKRLDEAAGLLTFPEATVAFEN